ncbi:MAG: permease-like cell division protein FtsX [Inconstantimicrobium porci]|uniref:Cell division protein FtsX n=1 Tax=Inconstantimicrobium porci TaxID=2652291 RepID=A0A7X2SZV5_9CLOT|nr:permease-like cell division protein FtsX [Inconstantimicrobium porci]MDD6770257.1 permease-like cell division protein FtsX [Inconstantimicrobium porci]MDY5912467.1 permease-like cell division protein FtsX [Inconstantimicrobium porci]MSR89897.1 ABC transporter permease [Inconstantimicrobium porci]
MKAKTARGLFKEGFQNIVRNRMVSLISISTVFLSLTLFSIFYIVVNNVEYNIDAMQGRVELNAFLNNDVSQDRIKEIKDRILKNDNVKSVEFTSSTEGLKEYKDTLKKDGDEEMIKILEESSSEEQNPIPSCFSIKTKDSSKNQQVKQELTKYKEIYKVNDGNLVTNFLNKISRYTKISGTGIMALLSVICIILISNTIKVAVLLRRKEISIIKYIGATNNYIRLPFISEGLIIGATGAILSLITVSAVYTYANPQIMIVMKSLMDGFVLMDLKSLICSLAPITIIAGSVIGILGSLLSIRKYMNV